MTKTIPVFSYFPNQGQFGPGYTCQRYNTKYYSIDEGWKTARAVSIIADIFAGIAFVLILGSLFNLVRNDRRLFKYLSVIALFGCVF